MSPTRICTLFRPADAVRRSVPAVIDFRVSAPGRVLLDVLTDDREYVTTLVADDLGSGHPPGPLEPPLPGRGDVPRDRPGGRQPGGGAVGRRRGATGRS